MATAPKFRIDVAIHDLLMNGATASTRAPQPKGMTLPEPLFPRHPHLLQQDGPEVLPEKRHWTRQQTYRTMRGWLFPYLRSRVLPGDFHPITAYLFVEYKCNLDCWYWGRGAQLRRLRRASLPPGTMLYRGGRAEIG